MWTKVHSKGSSVHLRPSPCLYRFQSHCWLGQLMMRGAWISFQAKNYFGSHHHYWHCNCSHLTTYHHDDLLQLSRSRKVLKAEKPWNIKLPASLPWLWGVTVPTAGILSNMDSTDWALLALELKLACVKLCFCFNLRVNIGTSPTSSSNPVVAEMVLGNLSILCSCSLKM